MSYYDTELKKWDAWGKKMKALSIFVDLNTSNCTNCNSFRRGLNECVKDEETADLNKQMICPDYKADFYSCEGAA